MKEINMVKVIISFLVLGMIAIIFIAFHGKDETKNIQQTNQNYICRMVNGECQCFCEQKK